VSQCAYVSGSVMWVPWIEEPLCGDPRVTTGEQFGRPLENKDARPLRGGFDGGCSARGADTKDDKVEVPRGVCVLAQTSPVAVVNLCGTDMHDDRHDQWDTPMLRTKPLCDPGSNQRLLIGY
jgi:hypothetical protein